MRLLVVIVNFRCAPLTIECLRSLAPEVAATGARVVVTDNASGDDSIARVSEAIAAHGWSSWCDFVPLARNGGFAYGNNEAIRPALASPVPPDYILLLNPDTLVRSGALTALLTFMEAHPTVGIAGSRLEHHDETPQVSAFRFHSVLSELENGLRMGAASRLLSPRIVAMPIPSAACRVDWVAGASMIFRRAVFDSVGLMDERYFMYFEEVDFCLRASRKGWPCWYVPESRVVHLVGQSSGVTDSARAQRRRPSYWFDSRRRYFLTNHGRLKTMAANLAWAIGFATFRVRQLLQHKPNTDPTRLLRDFIQHNFGRAAKG